VLAATNRADVLDPALLRPGRFDRRVVVQLPDRAGRAAILEVHTRNVPLAPDVSLARIAAETPGLVGADLRNLINEAALGAARKGADAVRAEDFAEALQKIMLGPVRHILLNPADRERTAYHESGHALLGMLQPGGDPVRKISIIPRGRALGVTFSAPAEPLITRTGTFAVVFTHVSASSTSTSTTASEHVTSAASVASSVQLGFEISTAVTVHDTGTTPGSSHSTATYTVSFSPAANGLLSPGTTPGAPPFTVHVTASVASPNELFVTITGTCTV